jgi:hypothetical protein
MPAARVIETVDLLKDGGLGLATGFPNPAPVQFGFDVLEKRRDSVVVMAIALAAVRRLQPVSVQPWRRPPAARW